MDKGVGQSPLVPAACSNKAPSGVQSICHGSDISEVFATSNILGFPAYDGNYNSRCICSLVRLNVTDFEPSFMKVCLTTNTSLTSGRAFSEIVIQR